MKQLIILFCTSLLLPGCSRFGNKPQDNGQERIVCISKQYSEIIFALGAEKELVAVDLSSTYPDAVKKLPTVGYHRALTAEGIIAQHPTLILHDNNIGPENVVRQLAALHIPLKTFADSVHDISQTKGLIREMGTYFHKEAKAEAICSKLDKDIETALQQRSRFHDTPKVMIIHFGRANNVYLTMTRKSTAAKMIEWAGGSLSVNGEKGMLPLSAEAVAQADPDVVLLTDFGYDRLGGSDKVKQLPGLAGTRAALNNRIYRIEEHDIVYLGPRTGENVLLFQRLIHQDEPGK